jgi:hypothetical protein
MWTSRGSRNKLDSCGGAATTEYQGLSLGTTLVFRSLFMYSVQRQNNPFERDSFPSNAAAVASEPDHHTIRLDRLNLQTSFATSSHLCLHICSHGNRRDWCRAGQRQDDLFLFPGFQISWVLKPRSTVTRTTGAITTALVHQ